VGSALRQAPREEAGLQRQLRPAPAAHGPTGCKSAIEQRCWQPAPSSSSNLRVPVLQHSGNVQADNAQQRQARAGRFTEQPAELQRQPLQQEQEATTVGLPSSADLVLHLQIEDELQHRFGVTGTMAEPVLVIAWSPAVPAGSDGSPRLPKQPPRLWCCVQHPPNEFGLRRYAPAGSLLTSDQLQGPPAAPRDRPPAAPAVGITGETGQPTISAKTSTIWPLVQDRAGASLHSGATNNKAPTVPVAGSF